MKLELSTSLVIDRPATLSEHLKALGYTPLDKTVVEHHKKTEQEVAPPRTLLPRTKYLFWNSLNQYGFMCLMAGFGALFVGIVALAPALVYPSLLWIPVTLLVMGFVLITLTFLGRKQRIIYFTQALWQESEIAYLEHRSLIGYHLDPIRLMLAEILDKTPGARVHVHELIQNLKVIDPVWEIRRGEESAFVAIADRRSIIAIAR